MTNWIPVTERLPEDFKEVLICGVDGIIDIACYEKGIRCWYFATGANHTVSEDEYTFYKPAAWQPLPEPYKEET